MSVGMFLIQIYDTCYFNLQVSIARYDARCFIVDTVFTIFEDSKQ